MSRLNSFKLKSFIDDLIVVIFIKVLVIRSLMS